MEDKTNNWAAFGSEYLKAIEVVSDKDEYAIVGVDSSQENGREVLLLKIQREETEKLFGCNKTNLYAVQEECPNGPKQSIGRIVTFNKVDTTNPKTGKPTKGLRIKFKPKPEPIEVDTEEAGIDKDGNI